jgi:hypothetical protein
MAIPVGGHGVFAVASTAGAVVRERRQLFETLAATTEAAFDRIESEANLSERESELEARNRRLQRQIQVTGIIRRIDRSLIDAESREEIESAVCEQLAAAEDVALAWVGDREGNEGPLSVRAWAGDYREYLDDLSGGAVDAEPATVAAASGEPVVVHNVAEGVREEAWRERALSIGFRSALSVPLSVTGHTHGVLTVYAEAPETFGDLERDVFAELGENIAASIEAVNARRALQADSFVELRVRVEDPEAPLVRIANETDARVEYEGLAARSGEESRLFVSVAGATWETVESVLSAFVSVADYRLVDDDGERLLFEATIRGRDVPSRIARAGGNPRSVGVEGGVAEAVVDVPAATDVREFVEELRERHPAVELLGRRTVERSIRTREELVASLLEELTDRQLEVLRTSHHAGFFEWPRASTGEEVAEMLGVSQPTVNRHLRLAQQRLLAQLFEGDVDPGVGSE